MGFNGMYGNEAAGPRALMSLAYLYTPRKRMTSEWKEDAIFWQELRFRPLPGLVIPLA